MKTEPDFGDAKVAGFGIGQCLWIGRDGVLIWRYSLNVGKGDKCLPNAGKGMDHQHHLGNAEGVHQLPHRDAGTCIARDKSSTRTRAHLAMQELAEGLHARSSGIGANYGCPTVSNCVQQGALIRLSGSRITMTGFTQWMRQGSARRAAINGRDRSENRPSAMKGKNGIDESVP